MKKSRSREIHLSFIVVILLLPVFLLLCIPDGYAAGGTFVVNNTVDKTDYSITVSYDGLTITSSEIEHSGKTQVHYGSTMRRGDSITISVSWSYAEGYKNESWRSVNIGGYNSYLVGDEIVDQRQEDKTASAEIWSKGETLDWV